MKQLILVMVLAASPALAQDDSAFVEFKVMKPEVAMRAAVAAMEFCRNEGYQVGVSIVDRFGIPQVFVRDRFAGLHVYETAERKAWTAVSFRTSTTALAAETQPEKAPYGIRFLSKALALGGGLLIEGDGTILGAIGVSGAPGPDLDDDCAEAGIAAIEDEIAF
ncbi:MAG: heme-binding protein [Pseudomonadota bacterium]